MTTQGARQLTAGTKNIVFVYLWTEARVVTDRMLGDFVLFVAPQLHEQNIALITDHD